MLLFLGQLIVVLLLLQGDLLKEIVLFLLELVVHRVQIVGNDHQFCQKLVRFRILSIQNELLSFQFRFCGFQFRLFSRQDFLRCGNLFCHITHFLQAAAVSRGDLRHHIQPVQQIGEAVGFKQDRPIRQLTLFFHGTDALFILLVQLCQMGLCFFQLLLLIRDKQIIRSDLGIDDINLRIHQSDLLINHVLLGDDTFHITHVFGLLILQILDFVSDLALLGQQLIELLFQLTGRRGTDLSGDHRGDQTDEQRENQQTGNDGDDESLVLHRGSLSRGESNSDSLSAVFCIS